MNHDFGVCTATLCTLGNIVVTGSDDDTQYLLDIGVLDGAQLILDRAQLINIYFFM